MTFKRALLAGGVIATGAWCSAASAQPFHGVYVNVDGGFNWRDGVGVGSITPSLGGSPSIQGQAGWVGLGSLGYGFGNGLRLEVEGNYRQSEFNKLSGTSGPTQTGGQWRTYGAMANALFDLDIGWPWLYPYLGAGAGYAWRDANTIGLTGANNTLPLYNFSGSSGGFATQAIAGLSFPVPSVPGLSLTAEYRFFAVLNTATYNGTVVVPGPTAAGLVRPAHLSLNNEFNNGVLVGLRYAFGVQPPPTPAPPPPPVVVSPTRSYLVFFDWDKATLTTRARQIIHEAADASTKVQYTRIEVNGYTDTSGSPRYNQGLSVRRAEAVAAELVQDGVPRASISIQGFGETHLLVPTGPGVREPQNRRVEIVIR
jgi:OmpA-OmpF porin, OOP family